MELKLDQILNQYGGTKEYDKYTLFRNIILRICEQISIERNKPFTFKSNVSTMVGDAVFPKGIDNEDIPTIIDIRYFSMGMPEKFHKNFIEEIKDSKYDLENVRFITIVANKTTKANRTSIINNINKVYSGLKYEIWDLDDISIFFEKYIEYFFDLIPELTGLAIKKVVSKSSVEEKEGRSFKYIEDIKSAYSKDELVLFLGAGVSASVGMPTWNALLRSLLVTLVDKNLSQDFKINDEQKGIIADSLKNANIDSPLLQARYIRAGLDDSFIESVSQILYKNISNNDLKHGLISAISNLCIPPRGAIGLKAIVNYNFDDLIEESLKKLKLTCKPIFKDCDYPNKNELGIYHVHGFLPRDTNKYNDINDSLIVFSEENYHVLMQEPYHWSNLVQLNFLSNSTCLFIGLSGSDPNLRRLLEIAKQKTKVSKHYIFLKRTSPDHFLNDLLKDNPNVNEVASSIYEVHHRLNERSLSELGLNIIWYNEYDEIIDLVNEISK